MLLTVTLASVGFCYRLELSLLVDLASRGCGAPSLAGLLPIPATARPHAGAGRVFERRFPALACILPASLAPVYGPVPVAARRAPRMPSTYAGRFYFRGSPCSRFRRVANNA